MSMKYKVIAGAVPLIHRRLPVAQGDIITADDLLPGEAGELLKGKFIVEYTEAMEAEDILKSEQVADKKDSDKKDDKKSK